MQIEAIETFLDLCQTRSFNRTADRLGVTQSTVSARVVALERRFGRRLFRRSRSGTELTPEGERFEPHARALRRSWVEAMAAVRQEGAGAMTLRVGLQRDLADAHLGDWIGQFRSALPGTRFYVEADFSEQLCADMVAGRVDIALLFTPRPHPDLHFEPIGEIVYEMVSDRAASLAAVSPETYILTNYSPAWSHQHAALHPGLHAAPLASGQNATVAAMLRSLGGTAYVLDRTAADLVAGAGFSRVADAPAIPQTVFLAVPLRDRHQATHRRLAARLRMLFGPLPVGEA